MFGRYLGENEVQGRARAAAAPARRAATRRSRDGRSSPATRGSAAARALNDFRFQYAYAAFYGYPGGTEPWSTGRRVPAGAARAVRRVSTRFPSLSYGNNYDYISPESRWEFKDTYSLNYTKHTVKIGGEYNYNPYTSEDALNLADAGGTYQFTQGSGVRSEQPRRRSPALHRRDPLFSATEQRHDA